MAKQYDFSFFPLNKMGKYGYEDSKSRRRAKLHDRFKGSNNFTIFFIIIKKNFKHRHVGCLSRGNRPAYFAAHSISFQVSIFEVGSQKHFKKWGQFCMFQFLKVLFLQINSPKIKFECAVQYFSPLLLDNHPTCICLKFLNYNYDTFKQETKIKYYF